jgi:REP element-mobilizing transposase RayT
MPRLRLEIETAEKQMPGFIKSSESNRRDKSSEPGDRDKSSKPGNRDRSSKPQKQMAFFKSSAKAYGGELLKTRKGRAQGRPLATKNSMHLVLRSSRAKGEWSFRRAQNARAIQAILKKFAAKYGVRLLSIANVGNHLHLHIQLTNRYTYAPFIRAVTGAIALAVSKATRWGQRLEGKFWDYRPFTRVVIGWRAALRLSDYVLINQFEALGQTRAQARFHVAWLQTGPP